jgi:hypothetical protein
MRGMTLGTAPAMLVSPKGRLPAFWFAMMAFALMAGGSVAGRAAEADPNEVLDVSHMPRLPGAQDDAAHTSFGSLTYTVAGSVASATAAAKKLLADDGWQQYESPSDDSNTSLLFKKGPRGIYVSFTMVGGKADQSSVNYLGNRPNRDLPFPAEATEIVYNGNRPYLSCITAGTVDTSLAFYRKELLALGWARLSATEAAARWPDADLGEKVKNGVADYFVRENQLPIVLLLQRRADDRINVEIKVAPFALPQDLEAGAEVAGLPVPKRAISSSGSDGAARRELKAAVPAEIGTVLGFYRGELAKRKWKEEARGTVLNPDEVVLAYSSADGTSLLKLAHKYDLTNVSLVLQVPASVVAAKAKAQKEASDKFMKDAEADARALMAQSAAKKSADAQPKGPEGALRPLAQSNAPVPLPDTAENIDFDGSDGKLEFDSSSSVKAVAAFYRAAMKPLGWKEEPSVINRPNMVELEFHKGGKELDFTVMQLGDKVNVSASGSGLVTGAAKLDAGSNRVAAVAPAETSEQVLEADEESGLPVPKRHTLSAQGATAGPGGQSPFRRELDASVPVDLPAVLAFYRRELGKRAWKESAQGAVVKPDTIRLAYSSPEGPAVLKLGRQNGETTVALALKIPAEAAKAGMLPTRGQVKLMLGNVGEAEAAITINKQTIKVAPGVGSPQTPGGPSVELPPGRYKYSVKIAGRPAQNNELEVAADDTWGLMVGPGGAGVMALHLY